MLNRQRTMTNSIDNMMASDARSTFASDFGWNGRGYITFSQDKDDLRSSHRTFATETTRSNANEQLLIKMTAKL